VELSWRLLQQSLYNRCNKAAADPWPAYMHVYLLPIIHHLQLYGCVIQLQYAAFDMPRKTSL
jgi:hypothetical protein